MLSSNSFSKNWRKKNLNQIIMGVTRRHEKTKSIFIIILILIYGWINKFVEKYVKIQFENFKI